MFQPIGHNNLGIPKVILKYCNFILYTVKHFTKNIRGIPKCFLLYLKLNILNFIICHSLASEKYDFAIVTIYLTNKM